MQRKASSASFKDGAKGLASSSSNSFARAFLLLVVALIFIGFYASQTNKPEAPQSGQLKADYSTTEAEQKSQISPKEKLSVRPRETLFSLEGVTLPATFTAMKEFNLLNAAGQETPIPANATIKVTQRSGIGTLTMEIDGALFVGNESRLSGKVK